MVSLRIISGTHRGRPLKAVPSDRTRPTSDKVKEAVFHRIGPYFDGGWGLDLFAGSGSIGIEGLSRGLDRVIFVDRQAAAIRTIRENLTATGLNDRAEVLKLDWKKAFRLLPERGSVFRLIWVDPPFARKEIYREVLDAVSGHHLLTDDGVLVCEHERGIDLPGELGELKLWKRNNYGTIGITIYRRKENENGTDRRLSGKL